mmetsp:Transcript_5868/g.14594  ORF Transcript_5868/g.14594 Transcript_5868/m.14594 type:complete len:274 (+) Transcript_5868:277-1098(+)
MSRTLAGSHVRDPGRRRLTLAHHQSDFFDLPFFNIRVVAIPPLCCSQAQTCCRHASRPLRATSGSATSSTCCFRRRPPARPATSLSFPGPSEAIAGSRWSSPRRWPPRPHDSSLVPGSDGSSASSPRRSWTQTPPRCVGCSPMDQLFALRRGPLGRRSWETEYSCPACRRSPGSLPAPGLPASTASSSNPRFSGRAPDGRPRAPSTAAATRPSPPPDWKPSSREKGHPRTFFAAPPANRAVLAAPGGVFVALSPRLPDTRRAEPTPACHARAP